MPEYTTTNENLDAILLGLAVQPQDRILAICGSGDQALAMAGIGAKVRAVDRETGQLEYAKEQAALFKSNPLKTLRFHPVSFFMDVDDDFRRNWYLFSHRIEIARNLDSISYLHGDIFEQDPKGYNKIYLSNASGCKLAGLVLASSPGTLFYMCETRDLRHDGRELDTSVRKRDDLTLIARYHQRKSPRNYNPVVFERL
ncbi:MAG: hypothetical protein HGA85_03860 [Nanoarchaeota archaeon]|nr:hypothetical protein [Nanoarchaeota archaeon]